MSTKAKNALEACDEPKAHFFSEQIDFIIDDVLDNVTSLSCHPYGCRVLQRILEHCIEPKKIRALDEISKCHRPLLDDQYGNYVIQHVLQYGRTSDRDSILHIVIESGLLKLSKQKFASNVVEKLLKFGSPGQRNAVVREMVKVRMRRHSCFFVTLK
jgi:pumilio RNA-binding family